VTYTDPADPLREVDILVSPPIAAHDLVARAIRLTLGDISVPVIAIEDLIAIKRASGRPQDLADVEHLERIARGELDD
jgi:predicted nucleotidyltransferase